MTRLDGAPESAHPRSRGENRAAAEEALRAVGSSPLTRGKRTEETLSEGVTPGSSPLTRGKRFLRVIPVERGRLIPAHAGKTIRLTGEKTLDRAHPRSRGENFRRPQGQGVKRGSSPLTRGKHFLTCAFTAQIDQILETLELAVSSGSYLIWVACATDAPQDPVRSIGLVLPSSRGAS